MANRSKPRFKRPATVPAGATIPTPNAPETLEDCPAYVKVNNPGICMVRVEKRIEKTTKDYDLYSLKAILVFTVK
jgi:hypothetical protein